MKRQKVDENTRNILLSDNDTIETHVMAVLNLVCDLKIAISTTKSRSASSSSTFGQDNDYQSTPRTYKPTNSSKHNN